MIHRTASLLASIFAFAAMTVPGGTAVAGPPVQTEDYFGVNISGLVYGFPQQAWGRHLDAIRAAGIRVVRTDAPWNAAEPNPPVNGRHRWDWRRHDQVVVAAAGRGLRWVPIVDYSAGWAASRPGDLRSPPRDIRLYAEYAGALAARYGPGGSFWAEHPELPEVPVASYEIWNAPNYVTTAFPAARYVEAYLAAREQIRAADPDAKVWVGGLAREAPEFLEAMVLARPDAPASIDGVGLHPYASNPGGVFHFVKELRLAMDSLQMADVPITITEVGWATQGRRGVPHAGDRARAVYYAGLARDLARSDCGVNAFIPHTWVTLEQDPANSQHWFGIHRPDGRPTATSRAYAATIERMRRGRFASRRASLAACGRTPSVSVRSRVARVRSSRTRRSRLSRRRCDRAVARLGRTPLGGASVRFEYFDRGGRRRRSAIRRTNKRGVASYCVGHRSRRPKGTVRLSVARRDLAQAGRTTRRTRLP